MRCHRILITSPPFSSTTTTTTPPVPGRTIVTVLSLWIPSVDCSIARGAEDCCADFLRTVDAGTVKADIATDFKQGIYTGKSKQQ